MQARRARIRGRMVAECVTRPERPDLMGAADSERRAVFLVTGVYAAVLGVYVFVLTTGDFLQENGERSHIAWVWGGSVVLVLAAFGVASMCFAVAAHYDRPPPWVWPVLLPTPLLGAHEVPQSVRTRWMVASGLALTTTLTVMATWPHVVDPVDRAIYRFVDESGLEGIDSLGDLIGSTHASVIAAVVIGIATLRCRRFAWLFVASVVISLATTQILRTVVDRPRPATGPMAGATDSFPSGHLVQATLLVCLVPLAVYELTRSHWMSRFVTTVLAIGIALVAIERIANARHEPTDVIAGVGLGLTVGGWARLALFVPGGHSECRGCAMTTDPLRDRRQEAQHV